MPPEIESANPAPEIAAPAPAPAPALPAESAAAPAPAPAPAASSAPEAAKPTVLDTALDAIGKPEVAAEKADPTKPTPTPTDPAKPAPATPEAAKPKDPKDLDLTPPEGMNDRSKERWATLTERAKAVPELERRATEAETRFNSVRDMVAETGLQADEFSAVLNIGKMYKSSKPEDLKNALSQIDVLRADVAQRLGIAIPGVDPLADYPDLQADVESMSITTERALEIAKLRRVEKQTTATNQEAQERDQHLAIVQQATQSMDEHLAARASQPGHQEKIAHIKQYFGDKAKLQAFVTTYRPEQWQAAVTMMYDSFTPPATVVTSTTPQPLRPSSSGVGVRVSTGPVSADSAVGNAMSQLGW